MTKKNSTANNKESIKEKQRTETEFQQLNFSHLIEIVSIFDCKPNEDGKYISITKVVPETTTQTNLISVVIGAGITTIVTKKGKISQLAFLGQPESVIFSILLKLFTKKDALSKPKKLTLTTSFHELKKELESIGNSLSLQEIEQSLDILSTSVLRLKLKNSSSEYETTLIGTTIMKRANSSSRIIIKFMDMIFNAVVKQINSSQDDKITT